MRNEDGREEEEERKPVGKRAGLLDCLSLL